MNHTLVIGGCRSGKSGHALHLADRISTANKYFLATCIPEDDEMQQRVFRHQTERGLDWTAVETPVSLPETIKDMSHKADVLLVDCLTLWVSNLMMTYPDADAVSSSVDSLAESLRNAACPVFLVTNDVGSGVVPDNFLARQFRDAVGMTNQRIASCVNEVIWMVAGIPVKIKSA